MVEAGRHAPPDWEPFHASPGGPWASGGGRDGRPGAWWRRFLAPAAAVVIGGAIAVLMAVSGSYLGADAALQVMGFDPDRAQLLASLMTTAFVVAGATLATGAGVTSGIVGTVAGAAFFAGTLARETSDAAATGGTGGGLDTGGWLLSVVTLVVAVIITAWAAGALALIVRRGVGTATSDIGAFLRGDRRPGLLGRGFAVALVVALLAVTLPVFGDMVNYTPDVRMRTGWDPNASATAVGGDQSGAASSSPGSSAPAGQPSVAPDPGASKIPTPSGGSGTGLPTGTPWKAWQPSGSGSMTALQMPAPWTGGTHATATLDIYTPPGYGTGSRAYPVMYSVPWGVSGGWTSVVGIRAMLDTLIERGTIPAQIVAFVSAEGGPYPDSECVNSVDGRQAFDTYFATTVVPYVDAHYRTIATPAARSIMGFSQGGYCATMLMLRHPTLFSSAISFSGYYQAGIRSSETPNAWRPFNGDPTVEAAWSPLKLAGQVAAAQRKDLFLILEADPSEGFFGPQYNQMIAAARAAGIGLALFPSSLGHGWIAPRGLLPGVLVALAERQVSLGVFR